MQPAEIRVRAPSRLHFGLFSFGGAGRQYGGVGVMVQRPALQLSIKCPGQIQRHLQQSQRLTDIISRWRTARQHDAVPPFAVVIEQPVPQHAGLGSGTQLALAVTAGLEAWCGRPAPDPPQLAQITARGRRSAVGTYGFVMGGLIVERGRTADEPLAPLERRIPFPASWRFLLLRPRHGHGLCGADEQQAFANLPPVSSTTRDTLIDLAINGLMPAAEQLDFARFSECLFEYGRCAGDCFAPTQGGPYNGPELTDLVTKVRLAGLRGVGQSSWGPTLFAVAENADQAAAVADRLRRQLGPRQIAIDVTAADNDGACLRRAP